MIINVIKAINFGFHTTADIIPEHTLKIVFVLSPVKNRQPRGINAIKPKYPEILDALLTAIAIKMQNNGNETFAKYPPGTRSPYGQVSLVLIIPPGSSGAKISSAVRIKHIIIIPKHIEISIKILMSQSFANQVWAATA